MKKLIVAAVLASILSSTAVAGFHEGVAAYEVGNFPLAVKEFRASAEKGDVESQFNIGLMYEQGIGVGKDEKAAYAWYRKSAEQGNSNAQYNLAVLYENGRGCDVDFTQAHRWYRKAVLQGDGLAIGNLGMLYVRGQGVKENKVAGLALLILSVRLENSPENHAKQNISTISGLTSDVVAAAQALVREMSQAKSPITPLDQYLTNVAASAARKSWRSP